MRASTEKEKRMVCPECGCTGRRVSSLTLRSLLKDEWARSLPARGAADGEACCAADGSTGCRPVDVDSGWRFCDEPACDVVYFAERDDTVYRKADLRVPVGIKEPTGQRPLCYCFGHSVESIKQDLRTKGRSDALEDIRAKMKAPGCHCETANPSGACCLGSVARGIEIARAELGTADDDTGNPTGGRVDDINTAVADTAEPQRE